MDLDRASLGESGGPNTQFGVIAADANKICGIPTGDDYTSNDVDERVNTVK